ncbi:NucA/NucB deoxyribonuclease domain-containing protein [Sphaerimonospora sp. CA-214678]|uniref:NucA/NucB deoxyribonuclease domain-containing protein n=1 Tax=Sphaerimonospora sp. CA-214678 TaxID=3240029 RepID=UPI003D92215C
MMATLATQFREALSAIEPGDDAKHAEDAHKQVSKVLEADEKLRKLGVAPLLIGSYKRHVSIRRVKDVDVFARLTEADSSLRPCAILDHVTEVLDKAFQYPFNSTQERPTSYNTKYAFSLKYVNLTQNRSAGSDLGTFYARYRILNNDPFRVHIKN